MAKKALGSGLNNLFDDIGGVYGKSYQKSNNTISLIECDLIMPNPMQPRQSFDEEGLRELADSIEQHGLLQPIVVREGENDTYILVAGERRFRATQLLKKEYIQAIVITAEDYKMRELALIENIQREDLNPIDLALCYQALLQEHSLTQEQLAKKIHKSRAQITNTMRLLELSESAKELLKEGKITQGHAKMLIGLESNDEKIALQTILGQKLNVRETEALAKKLKTKTKQISGGMPEQLDSMKKLQAILKNYNIASKISNNSIILQCNENSQIDIILKKLQ